MTDMSEMVERVAREILKANESKVTGHRLSPDDVMTTGPKEFIGQPLWRQFEDMARAAIAAMREPTEEMELLASETLRYTVPAWSDIYRAMIDAALTTTEGR